METNVVDERRQFVRDFASGHWSMTELCERYGVTRPTGYKWVARHRAGGDGGLVARSRAPHTCPHRTGGEVEALVVAALTCPVSSDHRLLENDGASGPFVNQPSLIFRD
jgi:transposase-like protein